MLFPTLFASYFASRPEPYTFTLTAGREDSGDLDEISITNYLLPWFLVPTVLFVGPALSSSHLLGLIEKANWRIYTVILLHVQTWAEFTSLGLSFPICKMTRAFLAFLVNHDTFDFLVVNKWQPPTHFPCLPHRLFYLFIFSVCFILLDMPSVYVIAENPINCIIGRRGAVAHTGKNLLFSHECFRQSAMMGNEMCGKIQGEWRCL